MMITTKLMAATAVALALSVTATPLTQQPSADEERRSAITVMRAINTAQNAIRQSSGRYLALDALIEHQAMGRVRPNIAVNGTTITHQGAQLRLALSADALQYLVTVVPAQTCGTAVFSDERGLIYTGKVLDC